MTSQWLSRVNNFDKGWNKNTISNNILTRQLLLLAHIRSLCCQPRCYFKTRRHQNSTHSSASTYRKPNAKVPQRRTLRQNDRCHGKSQLALKQFTHLQIVICVTHLHKLCASHTTKHDKKCNGHDRYPFTENVRHCNRCTEAELIDIAKCSR